ncbi:MAG: hypothetical protein JXR96_15680 [Deltaproteobacteria bacterium]|nr:hypothetical protein [Deltaproteobacteria bacterium]
MRSFLLFLAALCFPASVLAATGGEHCEIELIGWLTDGSACVCEKNRITWGTWCPRTCGPSTSR